MKRFVLKFKVQEYLPLFTLLLALSVLGLILFSHVSLSQQPPLYDPMSYLLKAKSFWSSVAQNKLFNPLNLEPTFRPPGTVLMSYPFGFSGSTHGFYFRSIFLPVILFVAALWVIAKPYCSRPKEQWLLVAFCLAFSTLPLFYHFELSELLPSPTHWGLVDNFFAAMAALSTALVIRGVYKFSIKLTFLGIITSAFCLFIKPAGSFTMIAIFLGWASYAWTTYTYIPEVSQIKKQFQKYVGFSVATYIFIYGLAVLSSFTSHYLSPANIAFGKGAQEVLKEDFSIKVWWPVLKMQIHTSFGWHWLTFIILMCTFSFYRTRKQLPIDLLIALCFIVLGLWFWLVATGQSQIRYFFPFALMSITLCFPRIISFYANIINRHFRIGTAVLLCPFILVTLLLFSSNPPIFLQHIFGVNLTSGSLTNEVQQAKLLVEEAKKEGRDLTIYSFSTDTIDAVFINTGAYYKAMQPNQHSFNARIPIDWINYATFRISKIISSDYLLFRPVLDSAQVANSLKIVDVADFTSERNIFQAWLSTASEDSGLEVKSETSLRLVKIIDRSKFANALEQFISDHKWRKTFLDANPDKWVDRTTANKLIAESDKAFRDIHFSDKFILLGMVIKRTNDNLKLEVVWESLKDQSLKYINSVHLVDSKGNILNQVDYPQDDLKQVVNKGRLWHDVVQIPNEMLTGAKAIGLGVYIPSSTMLTIAHGSTDWDGKRLLINIK